MTVVNAENYRGLALSIIQQACDDYRKWRKLKKEALEHEWDLPGGRQSNWELRYLAACSQMEDIERFLMSPWCEMLSWIEPGIILKKLKEEED